MLRTPLARFTAILVLVLLSGCASMTGNGNPELPYPLQRAPQVGDVLHLPTGFFVPEAALLDAATDARIVYVGETHDNPASHTLQLKVLQALQQRHPGQVALGMEMFTPAQQEVLDHWSAGDLSEKEFIKASEWGKVWKMNFAYYRELLQFAKDQQIPVIGLNAEKKLVRALGRNLPDKLSDEQQQKLPQLDMSDPYQTALVTEIYGGHTSGQAMLDGFQRIQTLWDETMAENVARYLQSPQGDSRHMLVIAGGNHIRNGFGIPRRVFRRLPTSYLLVGSTELKIPEAMKEGRVMNVTLPSFPMPAYDYLVYTDYETLPDQVKLGVMLEDLNGEVLITAVLPGSVAAEAGIREGDKVLEFDGETLTEVFDLVYAVQQKAPGDPGRLILNREGEELNLEVTFRKADKPVQKHKK